MDKMPSEKIQELVKQYFSDWEIVEAIGEGSYAKVYKIRRIGTEETAALKWVSYTVDQAVSAMQNKGASPDAIRNYCKSVRHQLENEIRTQNRLINEPNIISLDEHYVRENEDGSFDVLMRMELLKPITELVSGMRVKDVLKMSKDICNGLCACQKEGVVHRDIKPENIFIDKDGNYKLGDFGVAICLYGSKLAKTQRGTPLYMAPEVFKGEKYDAHVDTYGLGLVMYQLLNGQALPFMENTGTFITAEAEEKALQMRMSGEEAIPKPVQADDELSEIILQACEYRVEDRFESAEEMLSSLQGLKNRPEYEQKLQMPAPKAAEAADEQNPEATKKAMPGHSTLNFTESIKDGKVVNNEAAVEEEEADDAPEAEEKRVHSEKVNPFEEKRKKNKQRTKKLLIYSGIALAVIAVIAIIVLTSISHGQYKALQISNDGLQYTITWQEGGNGPWNVTVSNQSHAVASDTVRSREARVTLVPGYQYNIDVDGKIQESYSAAETKGYKGALSLQWLRFSSYTVKPGTALEDAYLTDVNAISANSRIGESGEKGYLVKGCVELPKGETAVIDCFFVTGNGYTEHETITVNGTDDGFRYIYVSLNDLLHACGSDAENVTCKMYIDGQLLVSRNAEIRFE